MRFDPEELHNLPKKPGVYLMKDASGRVLYIGKANHLQQRVKQYFVPGRDGRPMVPHLLAQLAAIETVVVFSEKEALLLENNLIKQHQPPYNILLKDDKGYIALKIGLSHEWPTVSLVRYREERETKDRYFGPYTSAMVPREILDWIHHHFPLRQCSDQELRRRTRPCLLYQMKRCLAPCCDLCSHEEYAHVVERVLALLKGDRQFISSLKRQMEEASEQLQFETADALYRLIRALQRFSEVQGIESFSHASGDAIGVAKEGQIAVIIQATFQDGRLVSLDGYEFPETIEEPSDLLGSFLLQRYDLGSAWPPSDILLSELPPDAAAVQQILEDRFKRSINIHVPLKGEKKRWVDLAMSNAEERVYSLVRGERRRETLLLELKEALHLSSYPSRIECLDLSHLSGSEQVGVAVRFKDGVKDASSYRTYRMKELHRGDDYAGFRELLLRHYGRAAQENLPDLVVVDGGKTHLELAKQVFTDLNLVGVDLMALAKEGARHDKGLSSEKIYLPGQAAPVLFPVTSPILLLLQKIRDEAHRFAITFQRKRRSTVLLGSILDHIPGIGPAKKKALLTHFQSIDQIAKADRTSLEQVGGLSKRNVDAVMRFFKEQEAGGVNPPNAGTESVDTPD